MALKLYNANVGPGLGRQPTSGPGNVARSKSAATFAMTNAFGNAAASVSKYVAAQDEAENELALQQTLSNDQRFLAEEEAMFEGKTVVNFNDPSLSPQIKEYTKNYAKVHGIPDGEPVPADKIIVGYMSGVYAQQDAAARSKLGADKYADYMKSMRTKENASAEATTKKSVEIQNKRISAKAEVAYQGLVDVGDEAGASALADKNESLGIWMPDVADEKRRSLGGDIDLVSARKILQTEDTAEIATLEATLWEKSNRMEITSKTSIQSAIDSYQKNLTTKSMADNKKWRENRSDEDAKEAIITMFETDEPMADIRETTKNMTLEDTKAVMSVQRKMAEPKVLSDDPATEAMLTLGLTALASPSETPMSRRKQIYKMHLDDALNNEKITVETYMQLFSKTNTVEAMVYNGVDYREAEEYIYMTLGRGSKAAFSLGNEDPMLALNILGMQDELNRALEADSNLPALDWVKSNMKRFTLAPLAANTQKLIKKKAMSLMVKEKGITNVEKSMEAVLKNQEFMKWSDEQVREIEKDIRYRSRMDQEALGDF